jgi:ADP-heptose:LPS heptosyltransferase
MDARKLVGQLKHDCLHFRGDRPCAPHRESGARCTCAAYLRVARRGVIIKLGAAGDVLRTTPLLRALDPLATGTRVVWVTHHPDLLPEGACEAATVSPATLARLQTARFDFCWNLDKDPEACALAELVTADDKRGFGLRDGVPWPVGETALHKFATGVDDALSKANTKSYPEEIFEIVGLPYRRAEYWLRVPSSSAVRKAAALLPDRGWVGLNTGAGARWTSRIWPPGHWLKLCALLGKAGLKPVLLGGPDEEGLNQRIASESGCPYPGVHSLEVFYALMHRCRAVVSGVTQAMHLAIAARTPLVLLNNIFNPYEFELYGRGVVVGPPRPCDCYYHGVCATGRACINEIEPEQVAEQVLIHARRSEPAAADDGR